MTFAPHPLQRRHVTAYIGLGANLGQAIRTVAAAIYAIDKLPDTHVTCRSSLYESAPIGFSEQPVFINAVVEVKTTLSPDHLMTALLNIEAEHGRVRGPHFPRYGPRTLDLDILLFENRNICSDTLCIPHPRMHERAFVLTPLVEIAPHIVIPGKGLARDLLQMVAPQYIHVLDMRDGA